MSSTNPQHGQHPDEAVLALYAGGDLDWVERVRVGLHVRRCHTCRQHVANHKTLRVDLASMRERHSDPLPDWDRLSEEMTANIRLGVSAADCVGPVRRELPRFGGFFWRPAVMATAACALLAGAFVLNMPLDRIARLWQLKDQSGLVLESTAAGIEMRRDGKPVISVRHAGQTSHAVAANLDGSMSAGYVDDDTGQVTIINVAGQ